MIESMCHDLNLSSLKLLFSFKKIINNRKKKTSDLVGGNRRNIYLNVKKGSNNRNLIATRKLEKCEGQ